MVSTTPNSLKAASLKLLPTVGNGGWNVNSKDGEEVRNLQLPRSSSQVNWLSCPLDDLLQQNTKDIRTDFKKLRRYDISKF